MSAVAPRRGGFSDPEAAIRLEMVTKRYPGRRSPAVDELSLDVPAGQIVVMVGPSACGKTTTLRLINRLISPDEGRILVEGEDVTASNPDALRRRMGYVIQQVGLFPHMTVADNVAAVPRMLGWERTRITARVDELLQMVGMDPDENRRRYPKELSGGQRQRVGVARAMAADPPVLLMDEPFGSIDPVTRGRLQDELLALQAELRKTILFVSHDIDEAVKMGDRIAVMDHGGTVAQYDTPERVLTDPANEFVRTFTGSKAALKGLSLVRAGEVTLSSWPVVSSAEDRGKIRAEIIASRRDAALVLDEHRRPARWVTVEDLERRSGPLLSAGTAVDACVTPTTRLDEALDRLVTTRTGAAVMVGADGTFGGIVDLEAVMTAVRTMRSAEPASAGPPTLARPWS